MANDGQTVAFIDTTIQVDRLKFRSRDLQCQKVLGVFHLTIATGMSLVEFKAVFIQQLITIHNQLRRKGARYTEVRDKLIEKNHPQKGLRSHIFNNWIGVNAVSSFEVDDETDALYAEKARLKLEDTIPLIYDWFKHRSATVFLNKAAFGCDRAEERPVKDGPAFLSTLPQCKRGKNKTCCVESTIRSRWPSIQSKLPTFESGNDAHAQFLRAATILDRVCSDPQCQLSVGDCRSTGDTLLAIEVSGTATHAISTNQREWKTLCDATGLEFIQMAYGGEETHS